MKLFIKTFIPALLIACLACKKEHLEPGPESGGNSSPVVYIDARLDGDSVHFAAGVNGYEGITSITDQGNNRTFNFALRDEQNTSLNFFTISVNNYQQSLGNPESDLDSTIYPGSRSYSTALLFMPLAATIVWTDASGIQYKSVNSGTDYFTILSMQDVIFESKKYKKTSLEFECALVYNFTDTIHLTGGKATVVFSTD